MGRAIHRRKTERADSAIDSIHEEVHNIRSYLTSLAGHGGRDSVGPDDMLFSFRQRPNDA
jgi:hypothetical protein